jgi:acetyltransferase
VYAVNPKGGRAFDMEVYKSLMETPGDVDVAVVLTPARALPEVLEDAREKGVKYLCIQTAGFSELGTEGEGLAKEITLKAAEYGIKFVGPNGLGVINAEKKLCLPFSSLTPWEPGPVSVIAQSGGVGMAILVGMLEHNVAANKFVSMGNKYSLDEVDFLDYFIEDENTKAILIYLEGMSRGSEFADVAARTDKPILLYKANTTETGARRAMSHTAAMANDEDVLDAVLKRAGVVRVHSLDHLIQFIPMFLKPRFSGRGISIVSPAGGFTVIAADRAEENGFEFPELSPATEETLREKARAGVIKIGNPVDLGDALSTDTQVLAVDLTLSQDNIAGSMYVTARRQAGNYTGPFSSMLRNPVPELAELSDKRNKPVAAVFVGPAKMAAEFRESAKLPVYSSIDTAALAMAAWRDFCLRPAPRGRGGAVRMSEGFKNIEDSINSGYVSGAKAFGLLRAAGVPVAEFEEVYDEDNAAKAASRIGFPIAMKVISVKIVHKTESGGIALGIRNEAECRAAYARMKKIIDESGAPGCVLAQKMADSGLEVIVGAKRDPHFGPVVMFGLGGVFVEIMKDVVFKPAPVDFEEALEMTSEIRAAGMLRGARGLPKSDLKALAEAISSVSRLAAGSHRLVELDINPLMVFPKGKGCVAVDARMTLK